MALSHSIPPFPSNINREHFASWISGFTDGEATFQIGYTIRKKTGEPMYSTKFTIEVRADDADVMKLIQSFFQCGNITYRKIRLNGKVCHPHVAYQVSKLNDLANVVIPHFDKYPLNAKKSKDYLIWKEAVHLLRTVYLRKHRGSKGYWPGGPQKWEKDEKEMYLQLFDAIRSQRKFLSPAIPLPVAPKKKNHTEPLFANLQD